MAHDTMKEEKQRLFVAIALPHEVRHTLSELQTGLRGMRRASPETLHVTLRFIGEVPLARTEAIKESLRTIHVASFSLQISELGCFDKRPQAVVWMGVTPSAELIELKRQVDAALERHAGLRFPEGRFSPHITLGRIQQADRKALRAFIAGREATVFATVLVDSFTLFSSVLAPEGAVHTVEAQYNLDTFQQG